MFAVHLKLSDYNIHIMSIEYILSDEHSAVENTHITPYENYIKLLIFKKYNVARYLNIPWIINNVLCLSHSQSVSFLNECLSSVNIFFEKQYCFLLNLIIK